MITRIYRVRIKPELRAEFEPLFRTVARASVAECAGCTQVIVGGPTAAAPDEYGMISVWESDDALRKFAGTDWTIPHVPDGMETFVAECWLHHFRHI
ncbi:Antibiotic biosynthesis monooxygenase [Roseivivax sp. THAF40]|uniref:putative quinol monooxygenase n=1 Tax=unclassified Roseivivax TaxID=2639302 RepID=UPI0012A91382|nr:MULTISPECIES: antibiotic biosynthesis monooxygenase [unclassified Roseivivax]QFS82740.1 Antibiotic biosynthesis monooxygenase [Roseivivax sp. THAF197b]QFT46509.1 Antibiotic biosynthesis monooxygenase [Roseivivax sp. THAF40]